jgi:hypothetical protein
VHTAIGSHFAEGEPLYIGVEFDPGDGWHYGWIGVTRSGLDLDVSGWAYETEAGVPIAAGAGVPNPIRFDNPDGAGHFVWYGNSADRTGLDITLDAASQTGVYGTMGVFGQRNDLPANDYIRSPSGGYLQAGGYLDSFLVGVDAGTTIPSGLPWDSANCSIYLPDHGTWLPVGEETYLGAQFPLADGLHYGWIGVVIIGVNNRDSHLFSGGKNR